MAPFLVYVAAAVGLALVSCGWGGFISGKLYLWSREALLEVCRVITLAGAAS